MFKNRKLILLLNIFFMFCVVFESRAKSKVPKSWALQTVVGENLFSKTEFINSLESGPITDILQIKPELGFKSDILLVGKYKAIYVDHEKKLYKKVNYPSGGFRIIAKDIDNDSQFEFLNKGGSGLQVDIYDNQGNRKWYHHAKNGTESMAIGDVVGDDKLEIVVGTEQGLILFDSDYNKVWEENEGKVRQIEMIDINNDGKMEITYINESGCLRIRKGFERHSGIVNSIPCVGYFSFTRWPKNDSPFHFLVNAEEENVIFDLTGEIKVRYNAPGSVGKKAVGVPVLFNKNKEPYFVVVDEVRASWARSILCIYSPNQELIYEEVIPATIATVYALPSKSIGKETLLVGGDGIVWEYDLVSQ